MICKVFNVDLIITHMLSDPIVILRELSHLIYVKMPIAILPQTSLKVVSLNIRLTSKLINGLRAYVFRISCFKVIPLA